MKQKKSFFLILAFLCSSPSAFGNEQPLPETIRIATYNLENFWDSNPHNTDEQWELYKDGLARDNKKKFPPSPQYMGYSERFSNWHEAETLHSKIEQFLTIIKLMKTPDIVALQELESARNRSTVFDTLDNKGQTLRLRLKRLGYKYFLIGPQEPNNPVSVTTAFISKINLTPQNSVLIRGENHSTSARDIQVVSLKLPTGKLLLFNNHWKSKRGGNEKARIAIAKQLKQRILKEEKASSTNIHTIVLGDLNASYHERPLIELGSTNKKYLKNKLYNLWYELPEKDRWESSYSGVLGNLSHILVSPSLLNNKGFHYSHMSFQAFGQKNPEKKLMLDVNGQPFRWQVRTYYSWFQHIGKGYSDHLPLIATFSFKESFVQKNKSKKMRRNKKALNEKKIFFNDIEPCKEEEAIDLLKVKHQLEKDLNRKCVKITVPQDNPPIPLYTRGRYQSRYLIIPVNSRSMKSLELGITMHSPFNWRPNVYDSRVELGEARLKEGFYSDKNWHPKSNKCFQRKVLQSKGGALRKVLGRVGYSSGFLSIHVISREKSQIILENLPSEKKHACPWN